MQLKSFLSMFSIFIYLYLYIFAYAPSLIQTEWWQSDVDLSFFLSFFNHSIILVLDIVRLSGVSGPKSTWYCNNSSLHWIILCCIICHQKYLKIILYWIAGSFNSLIRSMQGFCPRRGHTLLNVGHCCL